MYIPNVENTRPKTKNPGGHGVGSVNRRIAAHNPDERLVANKGGH